MKIERLIAILVILLNTKKTTAAELSEKFEVSTRTIYRDLDSLLVSGVPVMTMQGVNGGVYIDESYKLDNQYFSLSEITNLIVGIKSLESAIDDNVLITALEKLKSLVPKEVSNDFENMIQQISVDLQPWTRHDDLKENVQLLRKSLSNSQIITFEYINRMNLPSKREVEPYKLLLKDSNWYIEGYCLDKEDFRMFKLTRMMNLEISDRKFNRREFTPQRNDIDGDIKPFLINIDVEFKFSVLEVMVGRCGESNISQTGKTTYKAKMPFLDTEYSYDFLLGLGRNIKVIGPEDIKGKLIDQINKIKLIYDE